MRLYSALITGVIAAMLTSPAAPAAEPPAAAGQPATRKSRASTSRDYHKALLAFNRRTLGGAYQQVGRHNPKWDAAAAQYLDDVAVHFSSAAVPALYLPAAPLKRGQLVERGKALIATGCDDPLVVYACGALMADSERALERVEAIPLIARASADFTDSKYPPHRIAIAAWRLSRTTTVPVVADAQRKEYVRQIASALSGKLSDDERRILLHLAWDGGVNELTRAEQQQLLEQLGRRADADPWVKDVLAGHVYIKLAWDSRGSGWANTVTAEGWKGFHENLALARDALTRAWKLAPHLPEPASEMITVAMGAGGELGERPSVWFERALDAQVDWLEPYAKMLGGPLQPRWGGSHEEMLELGIASLRNGRYDTIIPWQYVYSLHCIAHDRNGDWSFLKDEKVYAQAVEVAERYAASPKVIPPADWYKSAHALIAWRAGRDADARKVLDEIGDRADPAVFEMFDAPDGRLAISSVYAHTGPAAEQVRRAEARADAGDAAGGLAELQEVAKHLGPKDPAFSYVNSRVKEIDRPLRFAAGEWTPLEFDRVLTGWRAFEGTWRVDPDGSVIGSNDGDVMRQKSLIWRGATFPGRSFEITGRFEFLIDQPPRGTAGVVFYSEPNNVRSSFQFDLDHRVAGPAMGGAAPPMQANVNRVNDFTLRCDNGTISVQLNGQPVSAPYPLPERFSKDLRVGLGGTGRGAIRYTNIKIRKLGAVGAAPPPTPS